MTFATAYFSRHKYSGASRQRAAASRCVGLSAAGARNLSGLELALQIDRETPWPTHRIRCFLLSQTKAPRSRSTP